VAAWLDGALYFSTGESEQKAVNLRGNPHVLLLTGCHRWDEGLDVVAEGDAIRVTDDALLTRLARVWAQKWDGQWRYQVCDGRFEHPDGGSALVFEVRPAKILAFAKGRFAQTRYRFS
jgi:hypothetical protein